MTNHLKIALAATLALSGCMGGGDGYAVFATDGTDAYDFGPDLADVTAEYLAAHSPYTPYLDGRISRK